MAVPDLSRRAFLGLAGGAVLLAACGGSDDSGGESGEGSQSDAIGGGVASSDLYRSDTPQRVAFVLTRGTGYYGGAVSAVTFTSPSGTASDPIPSTQHADGLPQDRGVNVVAATLDEPGVWTATLEVDGQQPEVPLQVNEAAVAPTVGSTAPVAVSPTVTDPLGVEPLCTRDPDCELHSVSLDQVQGSGRPVFAMFATPARCQTQYCGPTLDLLLDEMDPFRDAVEVVHVEIYQAETGTELVPTVDAWGLETEPWAFGIDGAGMVVGRLDGAFDRTEIRQLLQQLAG